MDLPLDVFDVAATVEPSERVGLIWLGLTFPCLIGEVTFLEPHCGGAYDDRMSYARIVADNSGVRVSIP